MPDTLRLWEFDPPSARLFRDVGFVTPLRARFRTTGIQFVNEHTIASFLLTKGDGHQWLSHVRIDRGPISGRIVAAWETDTEQRRRGYARMAVTAAVEAICRQYDARTVSAWIREGHLESEATAKSAGFELTADREKGDRMWLKVCTTGAASN